MKNIEIIGIYKNEGAKECFEECKKIYDMNNGKSFVIQLYNSSYTIIFDFKKDKDIIDKIFYYINNINIVIIMYLK